MAHGGRVSTLTGDRRRWTTLTLLGLLGGLSLLLADPGRAATPSSGTLSYAHPSLTWHNTTPLVGSAPALRRLTCEAPTACDDFTLTLNRGSDPLAEADFVLTTSPGSVAEMVYYPPGCPVGPTSDCYAEGGTEFALHPPTNGKWDIRVTCTACAAPTSYTVKATLRHVPLPTLPATGNQRFDWKVTNLPGIDAKGTPSPNFGEPGISINRKGRIIVNTFGPTVWVSNNNGKTFSLADDTVDTTGCPSGDADALVAPDGTLYADNLCTAGPSNFSYTSRDGGKTWNASTGSLPTFGGTDVDRQWYAVDPKHPGVVYLSYHETGGPNIWVLKSTDYGRTFTQAVPVTLTASNFIDTSQGNTEARIVIDPKNPNMLSLLYTSNTAAKSATAPPTNQDFDLTMIYLARSTDGGKTWTNRKVFDAGQTKGQDNTIAHEFSSTAIDSAGNVYVVFSERKGTHTQTHIELGTIRRDSMRMSKPVQVDRGMGANVFPWVTAGERGRIDVSWYGTTATDNNDTKAAWSEMLAQSVNALSAHPRFTQSRVSGTSAVHQADICLAGTLCLVTGGNRNLADFQGVDVDKCGRAELVWTDDHTGTGYTVLGRQMGGTTLRPHACVTASGHGTGQSGDGGTSGGSRPTDASRAPSLATTGPIGLSSQRVLGGVLLLLAGVAGVRRALLRAA